ncbi:MAG: RNase adapter RapZ [Pseudomonadota bacterium]
MQLIILSGRSGSGKSTALHVLEDIGFTCIDNLPVSLLPSLVDNSQTLGVKPYAVSIDARSPAADLELLPNLIESPDLGKINYTIIFLDADEEVLLQRFSETRRRHPLSDEHTDLRSAITKEKDLLQPIIDVASITIDTSDMGFHDLRDLVKHHISSIEASGVSILFKSFGFKYGVPRDADLVFDVRCLPNPHWKPELRMLTGNDQDVIDFLSQQPAVAAMYNDIKVFLENWLPHYEANNRSYMTIAIGCTGGQHRSVYLCNKLTAFFSNSHDDVQYRHRELK